jgi:hypothetical protein
MAKIEHDAMRDQFVVSGTYGTPITTTKSISGGYQYVITDMDLYRALSNTPIRGFSIYGSKKRTRPSYRQRQAAGRAARQRKGQA